MAAGCKSRSSAGLTVDRGQMADQLAASRRELWQRQRAQLQEGLANVKADTASATRRQGRGDLCSRRQVWRRQYRTINSFNAVAPILEDNDDDEDGGDDCGVPRRAYRSAEEVKKSSPRTNSKKNITRSVESEKVIGKRDRLQVKALWNYLRHRSSSLPQRRA